jgi:hypothetical protein
MYFLHSPNPIYEESTSNQTNIYTQQKTWKSNAYRLENNYLISAITPTYDTVNIIFVI